MRQLLRRQTAIDQMEQAVIRLERGRVKQALHPRKRNVQREEQLCPRRDLKDLVQRKMLGLRIREGLDVGEKQLADIRTAGVEIVAELHDGMLVFLLLFDSLHGSEQACGKLRRLHGLEQIVRRLIFQGRLDIGKIAVAAEKNGLDLRKQHVDLSAQLQSAHLPHPDIAQKDLRPLLLDLLKGKLPAVGVSDDVYRQTQRPNGRKKALYDQGFVVNDKN